MDDLLRTLFDGEYDVTPKWDKRQRERNKIICDEWEKVERMFGSKFVDRLMELESEEETWQLFQSYQAGFRLGVRLMLEALRTQS